MQHRFALVVALAVAFGAVGSGGVGASPRARPVTRADAVLTTAAGTRTTGAGTPTGTGVPSFRRLPGATSFSGIGVAGSDLVLTGVAAQAGNASECVQASLDPATLAIHDVVEVSCDAPRPGGPPFQLADLPVRVFQDDVRIAHLSETSPNVDLGPVVMSFGVYSDTRLVSAYGPGALWIYDVAAKDGAEVLRISEATGRVVQRVATPKIYRPVLAANDNGLYLATTSEGGCSPTCWSGTIFHLGLRSRHLAAVSTPPGRFANVAWLAADGDDVWADRCNYGDGSAGGAGGTGGAGPRCAIWRFDGPSLRPVYQVPDPGIASGGVIGDASTGLFTMAAVDGAGQPVATVGQGHQEILRIDPATGKITVVATIPIPYRYAQSDGLVPGEGVVLDGALYLLDGEQGRLSPGGLYSRLYRIPLGGSRPVAFPASPSGTSTSAPPSPPRGWSGPVQLAATLGALSCVGPGSCVGVGAENGQNVSMVLRAGRWGPAVDMDRYDGVPVSLSCTGPRRCVALQDALVAATYDGASWTASPAIDHNPSTPYPGITAALSCPTASRCVAVDGNGNAMMLSGRQWSPPQRIDGSRFPLDGVSCASVTFCAAVDGGGRVLTWNGTTWSAPEQIAPDALTSVSCAATSLCVVGDADGDVVVDDGTAWSAPVPVDPAGGGITAVSCSSPADCLAVDAVGAVVRLDHGSWDAPEEVDPGNGGFVAVSCSGATCVATDLAGNAVVDPHVF